MFSSLLDSFWGFFRLGCAILQISRRFLATSARPLSDVERARFIGLVHDRMTEMEYPE